MIVKQAHQYYLPSTIPTLLQPPPNDYLTHYHRLNLVHKLTIRYITKQRPEPYTLEPSGAKNGKLEPPKCCWRRLARS
ncbi:hypothetical protein DPMN_030781 [Dreissena polymorpha]|uniref:Uncharacterized protein n=1 Tax=Dreissena polymorpha TaxID=45954 RepID=A0A9D4M101_DREPO|nr:hypothetical protein DPMN_030781 [Dreissena polymorpha]